MDVLNNVIGGLSVTLLLSLTVSKDKDWYEKKPKNDYTIWTVLDGNMWIEVNGKECTASKGDVILFCPGDFCRAHTDKDGCRFIYSRFSLEMAGTIDILSGMNMQGVIPEKYFGNDLATYIEQFDRSPAQMRNISLLQYAAFLTLLTNIIGIGSSMEYPRFYSKAATTQTPRIRQIADYIEDHCTDNLNIPELAQTFGLSEKYLISSFKFAIGTPPKQYQIQCRLKLAAVLIVESDYSIGKIAEMVGYSDVYSFTKAFKKFFDETPTVFKKHFS